MLNFDKGLDGMNEVIWSLMLQMALSRIHWVSVDMSMLPEMKGRLINNSVHSAIWTILIYM
jgi:hypothetical protein